MIELLDWYADRCAAAVFRRDTYRHSGRGKSGFSMHHQKCQCTRKPAYNGLCLQHAKVAGMDIPQPAPDDAGKAATIPTKTRAARANSGDR